jgi:hypothetical protein
MDGIRQKNIMCNGVTEETIGEKNGRIMPANVQIIIGINLRVLC